jgi:Domain of unknown function (DUF4157)
MRTFAEKPKATQQTTSAKSTIPGRAHFGQSREVNSILRLQRMIGNQAVQRLLQANAAELEGGSATPGSTRFSHDFSQIPLHPTARTKIQPKLTVSTPEDMYEQEADRVAEQVMSMPEPQLQRTCPCGGGCPSCQNEQAAHEHLQTKPVQAKDGGEIAAPRIVNEVLHSPGQPLDPSTRVFMESRFGHDFSHVRVHSHAAAVAAANAVNARAFTVSNALVFGAGQYSPASSEGRRLLAHELTHVVQQAAPLSELRRQRLPSSLPAHVAQHSLGSLFRKEDKTVLEKEGVSDKRTVGNAADVQRIIVDTLSNPNSKLFPYIKDKLKKLKDGKTKYNIDDPAVFATEYKRHAKRRNFKIDPSVKDEDLVRDIGGFYDPSLNTVFLKTRSNYCHAFHETIHSFSSPDYLITKLGKDLMEGLTQFFTDVVFEEQVGAACGTHKYGNQLSCARKLVNTAGFDLVARVFFLIDTSKLEDVAKKLGLKDSKELQQLGSDGICKKLSSPLP